MLIRKPILEQIRSGTVTLAFRRWKRPTVKAGGTLKTAVGLLAIDKVETVSERSVTDETARQAGFSDRKALLHELDGREGELYRITLSYAGDDPRIALRQDDDLSDDEMRAISQKLDRLDKASKLGPWTRTILTAIRDHPNLPAIRLAEQTGFQKEWLKTNVRKLKNLGLTISHHPGYTLSPRGVQVLKQLPNREPRI